MRRLRNKPERYNFFLTAFSHHRHLLIFNKYVVICSKGHKNNYSVTYDRFLYALCSQELYNISLTIILYVLVAWPSGLRRWFKAPVSSEAWVRIPPLPTTFFFRLIFLLTSFSFFFSPLSASFSFLFGYFFQNEL